MCPSRRPPEAHPSHDSPDARAFWAFAAAVWEQPEAREILLRWQDERGIDVMFVLFACGYPRHLSADQWGALYAAAQDWNGRITRRVRALRRRIHRIDWPEGYRASLHLELDAERLEATWLVKAASAGDRTEHAKPDLRRRMHRLFPALPASEIETLLQALA
ncbi:DUF2390 domain-containing protein [Thioalkalivibrio sp.]|uniref:DUF2390 domain-containing protein n=1 Tax=Thioalkalivibrio sp. TaxID=2093813 RepID=UPI0039751385